MACSERIFNTVDHDDDGNDNERKKNRNGSVMRCEHRSNLIDCEER